MKSIEQLRKLQQNPFYNMSDEEKRALHEASTTTDSSTPKKEDDDRGKKVSSKGNAAVKETGKLDKHSTDPVTE